MTDSTAMKELLSLLLAERDQNAKNELRLRASTMTRRRVRLLARLTGWNKTSSVKAIDHLWDRVRVFQLEARSLSAMTGSKTSDPEVAMQQARARLETVEALLAEYRKKFPTD